MIEAVKGVDVSLRPKGPRIVYSTAVDIRFDGDALHVVLADGREIAAPLEWFPRLRDATAEQRANWRLVGKGIGIHWPAVDEDISVSGLMRAR